MITPEIQEHLYEFIGGIIRDEGGVLDIIGGTQDHIHLLVRWHTDSSVADLVRNIKSRSSRWIHETSPAHGAFHWQTGYGVFSVSLSQADKVRQYVGNQHEHHKKKTYEEEFIELLQAHKIEYDELYIWAE